MNVAKIREDFPILRNGIKGKPVVYLDSACMSLKPQQVIDKLNEYYNDYPACARRSNHKLSEKATDEFENSRKTIARFINAKSDKQLIFTRNTTEGINLVSRSLDHDVVITTDKEHNSNHVPWLHLGKKREIIKTDSGFDIEGFKDALARHKGQRILVSMGHTSNLDGTSIPVKEIIKLAHDAGAIVMLDGAQSVPHTPIDVKKLDVDLLAFSGHKMLGPTGTGVLYGKQEILERLKPYNVGGDTVKDTFYDHFEFEDIPDRFEAGLQDYAGFIGLGEAVKYLQRHIADIESHQQKLNKIMTEGLSSEVNILGPQDPKLRSGIFSFIPKNKMPYHEVSLFLSNMHNIMVRSGRHCVHSWFNARNIDGSVRASAYLYNTEEEAKLLVDKTKEILKMKG